MKTGPTTKLIADLLLGHKAADERESDSLRQIEQLLLTSPAPFSRQHFVPGHLTASAMVIDPDRTRTLLIFHSKLHRWLQPGGHFEPGENDPGIASAREVLEETGLPARCSDTTPLLLDVDVHVIPARKTEPEHSHFDLRMLLVAEGIPVAAEVAEARWFTPDEWTKLALDPGLLRALSKIDFNRPFIC